MESVRGGTKKNRFLERMPVLPGLAGKMLLKAVDPASPRKLKAPKNFQPAQSQIRQTIIDDFVSQQAKLAEGMNATKDLDLERIIITSPALSVITYSLMDAYRIIVTHERRHFLQAKRVTEEPGFPSKSV